MIDEFNELFVDDPIKAITKVVQKINEIKKETDKPQEPKKELKTKIQIDTAINQTSERTNWNTEELGKAPAMSYFEALATRMSKDDIKTLAERECYLKRFKNAYETLEAKCNALKKKMESIRFEEFNQ